jgi:hypothetical protein
LGRVYYPALPAVYGLIALSSYCLIRETARLLGNSLSPLGAILGLTILVWLSLFNLFIYFNEVGDPDDRQIRRELGEMSIYKRDLQSHLYLPYYSKMDDPLFVETQTIELYSLQQYSADKLKESYETIYFDEFLPELTKNFKEWDQIIVILDKTISIKREERNLITETLYRCFPGGDLWEGEYFDRYSFKSNEINSPSCLPVNLKISLSENTLNSSSPILSWELSNRNASTLNLECDVGREDVYFWEAEDFTKGAGWIEDVAFIEGWTGRGYLADNYGSHACSISFEPWSSNQVFSWIRYYKRVEDNSPAYLQFGDQSYPFSDVNFDHLNTWIWERIGPFDYNNEVTDWMITRPYNDDPEKFMALFIDSIVFTTDQNYSPEYNSLYRPKINSAHKLPRESRYGSIILKIPPGQYHCRVMVESNLPLVDAFGNLPIYSNPINITISE